MIIIIIVINDHDKKMVKIFARSVQYIQSSKIGRNTVLNAVVNSFYLTSGTK